MPTSAEQQSFKRSNRRDQWATGDDSEVEVEVEEESEAEEAEAEEAEAMSEDEVEEVAPPLQRSAAVAPSLEGGDVQISAAAGAHLWLSLLVTASLISHFLCSALHRLAARAPTAPACALPAPPLPCGREADRGACRRQRGDLPQLLLPYLRRARVRVPPLAGGRRPCALQRAQQQRTLAPEARQFEAAAHAGGAGGAGVGQSQNSPRSLLGLVWGAGMGKIIRVLAASFIVR